MKKISRTIPIPVKKLHEGFNECQHKVYDLLKSSQILFDAGQFVESLALSILAIEETTKLSIIFDHIKEKKIIGAEKWDEITVKPGMHKIKLTKIHKELKERIQGMSDEKFENLPRIKATQKNPSRVKAISQLQMSEEIYAVLAKIKNECFYVGWNADWTTLSIHLPNVQDQKDLAYFYLMLGWYEYYVLIFILKYNIDYTNIQKYKSHPYLLRYLKFKKIQTSKEYLQTFYKVKQILNNLKL